MYDNSRKYLQCYNAAWDRLFRFEIFSAKWWFDDFTEWLIACFSTFLFPAIFLFDCVVLTIEFVGELANEAARAFEHHPTEHELRVGEAQRAKQRYQTDLAIADMIDDEDMREAAYYEAKKKLNERLAKIMGA